MKTRQVDQIVNNDEYVRSKIFDGDLPPDRAFEELLKIEKSQHAATRQEYLEVRAYLENQIKVLQAEIGILRTWVHKQDEWRGD